MSGERGSWLSRLLGRLRTQPPSEVSQAPRPSEKLHYDSHPRGSFPDSAARWAAEDNVHVEAAASSSPSDPSSPIPTEEPMLDGTAVRPAAAPEVSVSPQAVDPTRPWTPGEIIEGRYEVLSELTGGAMGQVYRVKHLGWNTELVIKSPQSYIIADEALKQRFIREAESWVELGLHPHITTCYYVAQIEGMPRIVLEYVEGGTLKEAIALGEYLRV